MVPSLLCTFVAHITFLHVFFLPPPFILSLSLLLSLSLSLSLYLCPLFLSVVARHMSSDALYQIFSSWSILLFHTISFHSSYKIHQLFTDYLLRLSSSELLEKHLFRSRANRRLVFGLSAKHVRWRLQELVCHSRALACPALLLRQGLLPIQGCKKKNWTMDHGRRTMDEPFWPLFSRQLCQQLQIVDPLLPPQHQPCKRQEVDSNWFSGIYVLRWKSENWTIPERCKIQRRKSLFAQSCLDELPMSAGPN